MISGTSHFRTLTISDLVLKLHLGFLKNIMIANHDDGLDRQHDISTHVMTQYAKYTNVQNVQICTIWQNRRKWPKCEKHHFGGVKNRHISACKSVNFGCSRPWKSRRIMYCLVYRHPPKFDQIGVYRKYDILPKTPKC